MQIFILILTIVILPSRMCFAANLCDLYQEYCPFYISSPGSSYPSFADAFHFNPASIPTFLTPYGAEVTITNSSNSTVENETGTSSKKSGADISFALLKGLENFGIASSNSNGDTFYDYNVSQALQETNFNQNDFRSFNTTKTINPTVDFGTSFAPFSKVDALKLINPTFGVTLSYNRIRKLIDFLYGTSLNTKYFTVGASYKKTRADDYSDKPEMTTTTVTAGTKLSFLTAEYTLLYSRTFDPVIKSTALFKRPIKFITLTLSMEPFQGTYANRSAPNILGETTTQNLWSFRYKFTKVLSLAFMKNHIPGSSSLNAQMIF
jgi:hypothetical protein